MWGRFVVAALGLHAMAACSDDPVRAEPGRAGRLTILLDAEETGVEHPIPPGVAGEPLIFVELRKLGASDAENMDAFGAVAVSGDTAVVGAPEEDGDRGMERGAAYVFTRDEGGSDNWGEVTKLSANDGQDDASFGSAVALAADTALVGAPSWDDAAVIDKGAAYVLSRDRGGSDSWGEVKRLTASDGGAADVFGCAVALEGDTAIVGASAVASDQPGAAYVFARDQGGAGNWGQVRKLSPSDGENDDRFGAAVALSGDTALVGAYTKAEDGAEQAGAAYVFSRDQGGAGNWGQVKKLTAPVIGDEDSFAIAVAIAGDAALVAAQSDDGGISQRGAVYLFLRDQGGAGNWGFVRKTTASDAADGDAFGASLAMSGDLALVGAPQEGGAGESRGAVYVLSRDAGGPANFGEIDKFGAGDAEDYDYFGSSVALSGVTALVGAPNEDGAGLDRGAAYLLELRLIAGESCAEGRECASGFCADETCCESACGACGRCDAAGTEGTCTLLPAGTPCDLYLCSGDDVACPTSCSSDAGCVSTAFCDAGLCVEKGSFGGPCSGDTCLTACASSADCAAGSSCNAAGECVAADSSTQGCDCNQGRQPSGYGHAGWLLALAACLRRRRGR
jgi:hypothetical protein